MVLFKLADGLWLEGRGAGEACGCVSGQGALHSCILPSVYLHWGKVAVGASDAPVLAMLEEAGHQGSSMATSLSSLCSKPWFLWVLVQDMGILPWARPCSRFLVAWSFLQLVQDVPAQTCTSPETS